MAGSNIHSTSPDAYIVVFPYKKQKTELGKPFDPSLLDTDVHIISSDITAISTNKGKGAAGTFHVSLAPTQNYKTLIHSGCWIMIYIDDQSYENYNDGFSKSSGLKMLGLVRSIRCVESTSESGIRSVKYDITGDDYHSLLQTEIYIHTLMMSSAAMKNSQVRSWVIHDKFVIGTNPTDMVNTTLDTFLLRSPVPTSNSLEGSKSSSPHTKIGGAVAVPPSVSKRLGASGNKFNDIMERKVSQLPGSYVTMSSPGEQFSIWSLIKSLSNPAFNEVYTDLTIQGDSIKPTFVMRAMPFSSKSGDSSLAIKDIKEVKVIEEHEILYLNYGKSDSERFNMFLIMPSKNSGGKAMVIDRIAPVGGESGIDKLMDYNSIARFGLRPFITTSDYTAGSTEEIRRLNETARDMWKESYTYDNGQVTIVGSHEYISVGSNIEFKERGWIAHVENVSHQYHASREGHKGFFTTISFIRLQTKDGKPIDESNGDWADTLAGVTHSEGDGDK
jgi:hypothetical protein